MMIVHTYNNVNFNFKMSANTRQQPYKSLTTTTAVQYSTVSEVSAECTVTINDWLFSCLKINLQKQSRRTKIY